MSKKQKMNFSEEKNKMKKTIKKTTKKTKDAITKKMTFAEVLEKYPGTANILFESGLHCIGCGGAMYESIEQGCQMHGLTKSQIDDLIKKLNKETK
jgi:hybrid cluster-associated redox disulfide protein